MRKSARPQPKAVSKSTSQSFLTSRTTSLAKSEENPMASFKFSVKMESLSLSCGVTLKANGTRLVRSRTLVRLPSKLAKEMPLELDRQPTTKVMHFSRPVSMTRSLTWTLATVSLESSLPITE